MSARYATPGSPLDATPPEPVVEAIFYTATIAAIPAWLLLMVTPTGPASNRIVHPIWPYLLVAAVYAGVLATAQSLNPAEMVTWPGVQRTYTNDAVVLTSWLHFIALDLFAGTWQARDATEHGIERWKLAICLWLTFTLAPIGLALYLLIRRAHLHEDGLADTSVA